MTDRSAARRLDPGAIEEADRLARLIDDLLVIARSDVDFTRADDGRGDVGTGLGLAIVRAIARAHGGDAHIASGPEGGADVWLAIPATRDPVERSRSGPVQADPAMIAPWR